MDEIRKKHVPGILVDTTDLSREEWLDYRRRGIGGSDAAAVLGISPFLTGRDIYYEKTGTERLAAQPDNWVALEVGHLLEDLTAKIFSEQTGLPVYQKKKMFYHPSCTFMLADLDFLATMPDGRTAILEIKTTGYHGRNRWWKDGKEIVPAYYEAQARHYMAVMDIDVVFFCCLYGNTEDQVLIRRLDRDHDYEQELIFLEQDFWYSHVIPRLPPPYTENGDLILKSLSAYSGLPADTGNTVLLPPETSGILSQYLSIQEKKEQAESQSRQLEKELKRLKALLIAAMGANCSAECRTAGGSFTITCKPSYRTGIPKENLKRLQLLYPAIYEQFAAVTESRRFTVRPATSTEEDPEAA